MNCRQSISLLAIAAFALGLTACGGSGSGPTPPPAVTVSITGQPSSLTTGATASLTATVTNGTAVNWTVTCAASPCGSFNPASTASGAATVFTAPAAPTTVTVTATTSSGTAASSTATISITAPVIAVAFNPAAPASINAGATSPLTAVVTNDSKNAGVTWKVTCGSSACGSFNPASTASGAATTYTAPSAIPSPNTVTVTATSVTDTTKSATATITIGAAPPVLADGTYVYHYSGSDNRGPSFAAGAFTVTGGIITGGEQDFTDAASGYTDVLVASGSGLSVAGKNIQIVLATANTNIGVNGIETLRGTVVSSSRVLISEFDAFAAGTGSIDLQTSAAAPSGGYAFAISGWDLTNPPSPLAIGGIMNIVGTSLSTTGNSSVFDFNLNNALLGQSETFASGSVTAPDSFGRVTFSLTPSAASGVPQFALTGYIVGTNQIQLVESQTDTLNDDLGGMALGQGSNTGQFTQASIANKTYIYGASGQDVNNLVTIGGSFTFNTNATLSGNMALNDGNAFGNNPISAANYAVDPTGRVTLNGVTVPGLGTGAIFTFQLYLDGNGNALEIGVDTLETTQGQAFLQTTTTADFEGPYAIQGQGFLNATGLPAWGAVGPVTVASDAFTGFTDYTAQNTNAVGTTPTANQSVTGTETNSTSMLALTGLDSTALTTSRAYSYFPIDSKRVLAIEIDGTQLGILTLESTSH
ncbi:MAG TPA: hypothetical protein VHW70_09205 [Edaphobacter sp.]|nr:hypothetical protein [Edaphobacter sp.]